MIFLNACDESDEGDDGNDRDDDEDDDDDDDYGGLNLSSLNDERQKSGTQQTVQTGLHEWQYLATKWDAKNGNCDLVKVTRTGTIFKYFTCFDSY